MLDMVMVKQLMDIFVDKRNAIIVDDLMGDAKSTNYVLTNEIRNHRMVAFFNGITSTHFVKYSVATNIQI